MYQLLNGKFYKTRDSFKTYINYYSNHSIQIRSVTDLIDYDEKKMFPVFSYYIKLIIISL